MTTTRTTFLPLLLGLLLQAACARAQTHLAIVALDDGGRGGGDLLTAVLSGKPELSLLERNEVEKAFREQALPGIQKSSFVRAGQLLHADGLVLMQSITNGATTGLGVRLVAVNSGVVLDAALYPLPLKEPAQWGNIVSTRLAPYFGKLAVTRERAVPISIVNLRAAVGTPASARIERQLTSLLFHRLVSEREVFVLERKEMGSLQWEKDLAGAEDQEFWSSSRLLEGVIDRDGTAADRVTVHARLVSPGQAAPVLIEASGPRSDLTVVVEQLSARILAEVRGASAPLAWDRQGEAERFEQEAVWALRWGMWPEAGAAAESAWALGRRTEDVAGLRVRALVAQSHTMPTVIFDPIRNAGLTQNEPASGALPNAREALETYLAHCEAADPARWRTNPAWLDLGLNSLEAASLVLRHHYLYYWPKEKFAEDLPGLREAARNVAAILPADTHRTSGDYSLSPARNETLDDVAACYGAFWQETPEAAIGIYRAMLDSGAYGRVRPHILLRPREDPLWLAWSVRGREAGAGQWKAFMAELQASTNRLRRAEGAILKLQSAEFDQEIAAACEEFLNSTLDEKRQGFIPETEGGLLDMFQQLFEKKCAYPKTSRRQQMLTAWKAHDFSSSVSFLPVVGTPDPIADFFATTSFDPGRFKELIGSRNFNREEAERLSPQLSAYASRVGWTDDIRGVDARLKAILAPPPPPVKITAPLGSLKVTRVWVAGFQDQESPRRMGGHFEDLRAREGKLFGLRTDGVTIGEDWWGCPYPLAIDEIDLAAGTARTILSDIRLPHHPTLFFEVLGDKLYWIQDEAMIKAVDRVTGTVQQFPVDLPLNLSARITALGQRLFVTSDSFIAEFMPRNGSVKLLASARRKPAVNKLDAWTWPSAPEPQLLTNGLLLALFGAVHPWVCDATVGDWNQLPDWAANGSRSAFDGRPVLIYDRQFQSCLDQYRTPDGSLLTLLSYDPTRLPVWPMPYDYHLNPGMGSDLDTEHAFDGTNLWISMPPVKAGRNGPRTPLTDRHVTLLRFDPRWDMPVEIPLWFDALEIHGDPPRGVPNGTRLWFVNEGLLLLPPDPGLRRLPGFWFVPRIELDNWVEQHRAQSPNLPRHQAELLRQFDRNQDGKLDPDELRAMQADAGWRKAEAEFQARRLLLTFDANGDGKLDAVEAEDLVKCSSIGLGGKVGPTYNRSPLEKYVGAPEVFLNQYDRNHDHALDAEELVDAYLDLDPSSPEFASRAMQTSRENLSRRRGMPPGFPPGANQRFTTNFPPPSLVADQEARRNEHSSNTSPTVASPTLFLAAIISIGSTLPIRAADAAS